MKVLSGVLSMRVGAFASVSWTLFKLHRPKLLEPRGKHDMSILSFTGIIDSLNVWTSLHSPSQPLSAHDIERHTMASKPLLNGNGSANGHIPHTHVSLDVSSESASTERIQIVNEEKNFTLVCSERFLHNGRVVDTSLQSRLGRPNWQVGPPRYGLCL